VRENDDPVSDLHQPLTTQSSPSLLPAVAGLDGPLEGVPEEGSESGMSLDSSTQRGLFAAFSGGERKSGGGRGFWNLPDNPAHTPPPSFRRAGSSAISEDISMDSPPVSISSASVHERPTAGLDQGYYGWAASRGSTPQPQGLPTVPLNAVDGLKKSNKRRRDDDLDGNSIKRRAVSPGVSVQNSPVLSQSPAQRGESSWGTVPKTDMRRESSVSGVGGHAAGERSNSGGSVLGGMTPSLGPKRFGLQGMVDTSDGFMKMSIE
jgi:hypothetical protein